MLSLRIDQFEFDDPGSEEALEIDISRKSKFPHPDVSSFVGATVGVKAASELPEPKPFYLVQARSQVSEYVKRFANIELPLHSDWPTYALENESWDETHLVICGVEVFIRYQWSTSA
ncbi:hypothetical protein [Piscinibacter gummiphilus]|uniref:Uncharacterized protein n=1 Tax=Piscinibacter gummiphilus TaxID=946333 RepID=A0ABZ0CPL6_9BURK|nr:hypothetical protein [Piscinibacter gummiphilus]WOB06919.1 hypothetical protein RXV79_18575 [Piscinibacter gummiphilus]